MPQREIDREREEERKKERKKENNNGKEDREQCDQIGLFLKDPW